MKSRVHNVDRGDGPLNCRQSSIVIVIGTFLETLLKLV